MKKERPYNITLEILGEYQKYALENAFELVEEAQTLLEQKHFARAYYLGIAALEESGKAFLAFLSKGRNLNDPGIQRKIKANFEDHRSKILSSLGCLLNCTNKTKDEINYFIEIAFALEVGREQAMYVDISDTGTAILPKNSISKINATDCLRLARAALDATVEYISTNSSKNYSPYEDKLFCIRTEKLFTIMNSSDFGTYLHDLVTCDSSMFDLTRALVKYHDEFFSKGKLYSQKSKTN